MIESVEKQLKWRHLCITILSSNIMTLLNCSGLQLHTSNDVTLIKAKNFEQGHKVS